MNKTSIEEIEEDIKNGKTSVLMNWKNLYY